MSSGASLGLDVHGGADVFTHLNPEKTFFAKQVQTHTHFTRYPKEFLLNNNSDFKFGKTYKFEIDKPADLMGEIRFKIGLDKLDSGNGGARWTNDVGHAMFEQIKLIIGNLEIDVLDDMLMHVEETLYTPTDKRTDSLTLQSTSTAQLTNWAQGDRLLYVRLPFYWREHPGYYLPTVGMYLSKIELQVKFRKLDELVVANNNVYNVAAETAGISSFTVHGDLYLLSEAEQNYFADGSFFHVFTQHQHYETLIKQGSKDAKVTFQLKHPCKELNIVFRSAANVSNKNYYNFSGEEPDPTPGDCFKGMYLQINQSDWMDAHDPLYFRIIENVMFHSVVPQKHIYTFSFALFPQLIDPTGTLNFSRLDSATLIMNFSAALSQDYEMHILTKNLNGLTIENGVTRLEFGG